MRKIKLYFFVVLILTGCVLAKVKDKNTISYSKVKLLKVGVDSEKSIKGYERLFLEVKGGVLKSVHWSIWDEDDEFNVGVLLSKVNANFKIIKEPVTNPHRMPSMCYLVDNNTGISIKVSTPKHSAESISFWEPSSMKGKKWFDDSTPEFCIANHCSRVTDPGAWKYNHCEWLEKLISK